MTNAEFLRGMSVGLVAGATIGFAVAPKNKSKNKRPAARAIKAVGDVVSNITDAIGM